MNCRNNKLFFINYLQNTLYWNNLKHKNKWFYENNLILMLFYLMILWVVKLTCVFWSNGYIHYVFHYDYWFVPFWIFSFSLSIAWPDHTERSKQHYRVCRLVNVIQHVLCVFVISPFGDRPPFRCWMFIDVMYPTGNRFRLTNKKR